MSNRLEFATTPPGVLQDDEALQIETHFDSAPEELKPELASKLLNYKAFRSQFPKPLSAEDKVRRTSNFDALVGLAEDWEGTRQKLPPERAEALRMNETSDPETAKRMTWNMAFLGHSMDRRIESNSDYDNSRDSWAVAHFGNIGVGDDAAFYTQAKKAVLTERDENTALFGTTAADAAGYASRESSLVHQVEEAAIKGQPMRTALTNWQRENTGKSHYSPDKMGEYEQLGNDVYSKMTSDLAAAKPVADAAWHELRRDRGEEEGQANIRSIVPLMRSLTSDQQGLVMRLLKDRGESEALPKGFWEATGTALARGEEQRSTEGSETTQLKDVVQARGEFHEGSLVHMGSAVEEVVAREAAGRAQSDFAELGFLRRPTRPLTAEEAKKWNADIEQEITDLETYGNLRRAGADLVDPVKGGGWIRRKIWEPGVESIPLMASMMVPGAEILAMDTAASGYQGEEYRRLRGIGMDPTEAMRTARISGLGQAALDRLEAASLVGKLPGVSRLLAKIGVPTAGLAGAAVRFATISGEQTGIELLQDHLVPALVQDVMASRPEFDPKWGEVWKETAAAAPDTFLGMVLLSGAGAAYGAHAEGAQLRELTSSRAVLRLQGYSLDQIDEIQAAPLNKKGALLEDYRPKEAPTGQERTDMIREAIQLAQEERAKAEQTSAGLQSRALQAGVTISRNDGGWEVRDGAGNTTNHTEFSDAFSAFRNAANESEVRRDEPFLSAIEEFAQRSPSGESFEVRKEGRSLAAVLAQAKIEDDQDTVDAIWSRVEVERAKRGRPDLTPEDLIVLGDSRENLAEGVASYASRIWSGGNVLDLVEEKSENDVKRWVREKRTTYDRMAAMIREVEAATGDTYLHGYDQTQGDSRGNQVAITEAYSDLARAYATGHRRGGAVTQGARGQQAASARALRNKLRDEKDKGTAPPLMKALSDTWQFFKGVLAQARRLGQAKEAGKLGDVEQFLTESVGLSEQRQHNKAVAEASGVDTTAPAAGQGFSLALAESMPIATPSTEADGLRVGTAAGGAGGRGGAAGAGAGTYSVTPKQDADYMAAVESGDEAKQREMVDEAAKAAGYEFDSWHGSKNSGFTKFDKKFSGKGVVGSNSSGGFYFSNSKHGAEWFADPVTVEKTAGDNLSHDDVQVYGDDQRGHFVLIENEDGVEINTGPFPTNDVAQKAGDGLVDKWNSAKPGDVVFSDDRVMHVKLRMQNPLRVESLSEMRDAERLAYLASDAAPDYLKSGEKFPYDGILAEDITDGDTTHDIRIVFDPSQIKSAEPITRDNAGNVIPLSERFNPATPNINFSLASADYLEALAPQLQAKGKPPAERRAMYAKAQEQVEGMARAMRFNDETGKPPDRKEMLRSLATFDAILMAFPPDVRGKVGGFTKLASLQTNKAREAYLRTRIEKLDKVLETHLRGQYSEDFKTILDRALPAKNEAGKKMVGKAGAEIHDLFNVLREAKDWDADTVAAHVAGLEAQIAAGNMSPEAEAMAQLEAQLVPLVGDWKNADAARMASAVDAVDSTLAGGLLAWQAKKLKQREERKATRESLMADTGKLGTREQRVAEAERESGVKGLLRRFLINFSSFEEFNHFLFGKDSVKAKEMVTREREASNAKDDELDAMGRGVSDLFTALAGSPLAGEKLRFSMAKQTIDGKQAGKMSPFEAIQATLMWRQPAGQRHMIGKLDENGKPSGPWHYDQAWIDHIEAQLSPEAKAVRQHISDDYAKEWETLNPLYQERHGVSLPRNLNYAPITVAPQQAPAGQMTDPVSGISMTGTSITPGSLRTRSTSAIAEPVFRDALQTFIAHKKQMAHWKSYGALATDMSAIFGNRELGNTVEAKGGEQSKKVLSGWVDFFAQGGTRDAQAQLAVNQALNRAMGRSAGAALIGRASVLIIQSTQLASAAVEMPTSSYVLRLGKLLSGRLAWTDAIKSPFIQRRLQQMPPLLRQAMEGLHSGKPSYLKHQIARIGTLINGADGLFTAGTYAILFDYHKGKAREAGMHGAAADSYAHAAAETATERVAQPTRAGTRSLYENTTTNPFARAAALFGSEARQKLMLAGWAATDWRKNPKRAAKVLALTWGVGGIGASIIRNAWRDLRDDDDDELFDEKNWSWKRIALASLTGPVQGIPFLGDAVEGGIGKLLGEGKTQKGILEGTTDATDALVSLASGDAFEDDEPIETTARRVESLLSGLAMTNDSIAAAASVAHIVTDAMRIGDALHDDRKEAGLKQLQKEAREAKKLKEASTTDEMRAAKEQEAKARREAKIEAAAARARGQ